MNYRKKLISEKVFSVQDPWKKSGDYSASPFRYPGGKFYALKFIVPILESVKHKEYREPFVGGGSVFFGKKSANNSWINDLEGNLVDTYRIIKSRKYSKILVDEITKEVASRERHAEVKMLSPSSKYEMAYKTYYLNRTSYSGIINKPAWGYKVGNSSPPENWGKFITNASRKLKNTKITNLDFADVVNQDGDDVLIYLDPPYFHADQKRAYTKSFALGDHIRLEETLKETSHYFCLSYDDCKEIRELYKWANIYERSWFYNTANSSGPRKVGNELIITNYNIQHPEQKNLF